MQHLNPPTKETQMQSQNNTSANNVNSSTIMIGNKLPPFSWLPNYLINDPTFSAEAMACALYLNGKPAGWQTHPNDVRKRFGWGRHTWLMVSKELKERNLLHETKHAGGTSLSFEIRCEIAAEQRQVETQQAQNPPSDFRTVRKPTVGKSTPLIIKNTNNKDLLNNKDSLCILNENEISSISGSLPKNELDDMFNLVWERYPLKKGKEPARKSFIKCFDNVDREQMREHAGTILAGLAAHIAEHEAKTNVKNQGGDIWVPELPMLVTWLNQKRWNDDYLTPEQIARNTKPKRQILDCNAIFGGGI